MRRVITATDARIRFGELIRRVADSRESVIVERGGKPQVVIISLPEYEQLLEGQQKDSSEWKILVDAARERIRAESTGRKRMPPEEVIARMREDRDDQLVGLR